MDKIHCIRGYKLWFPRIPREHNKYHGYTTRGTPNCPLIVEVPKNLYNTFFPWKFSKVFGEGGVNTPQDIAQYIWAVIKSIVRLDMLSSLETCLKECDANNLKALHLPIPQNSKIHPYVSHAKFHKFKPAVLKWYDDVFTCMEFIIHATITCL